MTGGQIKTSVLGTGTADATTFLRGDSTWAAPAGGGTPQWKFATIFETAARGAGSLGGTGANSFGNAGLESSTGATATSFAKIRYLSNQSQVDLYASTSNFSNIVQVNGAPTTGDSFFGVANNITVSGSAITYTADQFGFKIVYAASTAILSATNANGTTETATDITTGVTVTQDVLYHAIKTGTTNIVFYTNRSLRATHTTNLPDTAGQDRYNLVTSNKDTATSFSLITSSYNYEQNAE